MNAPLAIAPQQQALPPALLMDEEELFKVLESSLYRGAKRESIKMVIGYCRAQRLDPMQKPVHIVPVNTKVPRQNNPAKFDYEWVDTVWPGINLYRTNASRSGRHAGTSEPEFGPTITREFVIPPRTDNQGNAQGQERKVTVSFPEWCRVIVKKVLDNGVVAEFVAREFWVENYATVGAYSDAPNAMWTKRPSGQLAKCTEAQALRKAFPESCSAPTAEEMEGKTVDEHGQPVRMHERDPNAVDDDVLQAWLAKARDAQTDAQASAVYAEGVKVLNKDVSAAAEFKRVVIERRRAIAAGVQDAPVKESRKVDPQPADPARGEESQDSGGFGDAPDPQVAPEKKVTFASVLDDMQKAVKQKNAVALDVAADWIEAIPADQQDELRAKYEELKKELQK